MEHSLRQYCTCARPHDRELTDSLLERAVKHLQVHADVEVDLIGICKDDDLDDTVALVTIEGCLDRLWRDWSDPRDNAYWLEGHDRSGTIKEIASSL